MRCVVTRWAAHRLQCNRLAVFILHKQQPNKPYNTTKEHLILLMLNCGCVCSNVRVHYATALIRRPMQICEKKNNITNCLQNFYIFSHCVTHATMRKQHILIGQKKKKNRAVRAFERSTSLHFNSFRFDLSRFCCTRN